MFCVCFCVCDRQKPEDPKLSPMTDEAITWGGIGSLVSALYICGVNGKLDWVPVDNDIIDWRHSIGPVLKRKKIY